MDYCTGACLFGKCPFDKCIRDKQISREAVKLRAKMNILESGTIREVSSETDGFGVAIDIGTTTVVASLYDLKTCKRISAASCLNSQATLGTDVISRIKFAGEIDGGLAKLNRSILRDLKGLLEQIAQGINIKRCVITANTTMLHLLANIPPDSMGVSPFEPLSRFGDCISGNILGIGCDIKLVRCISSFVGADITSAILATNMTDSEETSLLLDIGTNGEVALCHNAKLVATSTAAGPAFEGASIECGMAGVKGAISKVYIKNGLQIETIEDAPPIGICGSGLLDAVALMLETGIIDETGAFSDTDAVSGGKFYLSETVYISQKDIRELQAAKAAIAAGVLTLLHVSNISYDEIDSVFLAGGFGNFMNPVSAAKVGILPEVVLPKVHAVGNAALSGAILALLRDDYFETGSKIADTGEHVELGHNPYFMDKYIDCMMFEDVDLI